MAIRQLLVKALCIAICLASSPSSDEEIARDFIEHVLRIPNPDKVMNTVLGRLERNRQQGFSRQQASEEDCDDPSEITPEYTEALTQGSRERELRQLGAHHVPKHSHICFLHREIKKLNTNEYEYRPAYYEEVRCATTPSDISDGIKHKEPCTSLGLACVQWNKTIHLTRRRYSSDCWETRTMVIPAGCECMWPQHRLGDMKLFI